MRCRFNQKIWEELDRLNAQEKIACAANANFRCKLFEALTIQRGRGRNDYPISEMWDHLISKLTLGKLPQEVTPCSISRFLSSLLSQRQFIEEMLANQIRKYHKSCPEFGSILVLYKWENSFFLLDGTTALPIVSQKTANDPIANAFTLLEKLEQLLPGRLYKERSLIADSAFDDIKFITDLWDRYQIKPIIPLSYKKENSSIELSKNCLCDPEGQVQCERKQPMSYSGFEKKRNTLKFRCIFSHYGLSCQHEVSCRAKAGLRVSLRLNRRLITPIPRCSCKWAHLHQLSEKASFFERYFDSFLKRNRHYTADKEELIHLLGKSILYAQVEEARKKVRANKLFTIYGQSQNR
jgi:hypothetical protein